MIQIQNNNKYYSHLFIILVTFIYILIPILVNSDYHLYSNDYIEYSNWYDSIKIRGNETTYTFGIGYEYIALFFKEYLSFNYISFNISMIYFSLGLKIIAFNRLKRENRSIILIIYILVLLNIMEMAQIRDSIATGIYILLIAFDRDIGFSKKLIILLFAVSIHYIAILYLFFEVNRKLISKKIPFYFYVIFYSVIFIIFYKYITTKEIFEYIEVPNKYYLYFDENLRYIDPYSWPTKIILLIMFLTPINYSPRIYFLKNLTIFLLIISMVFSPINFISARFLYLSYLFNLFWIYGYYGRNMHFIILLNFLASIYIFIFYNTQISSYISNLI